MGLLVGFTSLCGEAINAKTKKDANIFKIIIKWRDNK